MPHQNRVIRFTTHSRYALRPFVICRYLIHIRSMYNIGNLRLNYITILIYNRIQFLHFAYLLHSKYISWELCMRAITNWIKKQQQQLYNLVTISELLFHAHAENSKTFAYCTTRVLTWNLAQNNNSRITIHGTQSNIPIEYIGAFIDNSWNFSYSFYIEVRNSNERIHLYICLTAYIEFHHSSGW